MTESYLHFVRFVGNVETFLASDDEKYARFHDILSQFQRCPKRPRAALESLRGVLDGTDLVSEINAVLEAFPPEEDVEDRLCRFMDTVNQMDSSGKLGLLVGESLSYVTEGYVSLEFFHHYLDRLLASLAPELQNQVHWAADELILCAKVSRVDVPEDDERTVFHSIPVKFDVSPLMEVPGPLRLLTMINLIVPEQMNIVSAIKCIRLYAKGGVSVWQAAEWMGKFDPYLESYFRLIVMKHDPSSFSPKSLRSAIEKQIKVKKLQAWAFGTVILDQLSAHHPAPPVDTSSDRGNMAIWAHGDRIAAVPASIMELQMWKYHQELRNVTKCLRDRSPVVVSTAVLSALYGKRFNANGPAQKGVIMDKIHAAGKCVFDTHLTYYRLIMAQHEPHSVEWRTNYSFIVSPKYVRLILCFTGMNVTMHKEAIALTSDICARFLGRFSAIRQDVMAEIGGLFDSQKYMTEQSALIVFYFATIAHIIDTQMKISSTDVLRRIPDLMFDDEAPFSEFQGQLACNIDVPLLQFAKAVKRASTCPLFCDYADDILADPASLFVYQSTWNESELLLIASPNPVIHESEQNTQGDAVAETTGSGVYEEPAASSLSEADQEYVDRT